MLCVRNVVEVMLCQFALCATYAWSQPRTDISFDFGWRHVLFGQRNAYKQRPPESRTNYNDDRWSVVNAPHDAFIVNRVDGRLCPDGCSGNSYIPRYSTWYRKVRVGMPWDVMGWDVM